MDIIRLGELQESGNPLSPGRQYEGGPITIGDTPAFGWMEFFKLNENMYISTQVWLPQITWRQLERQGFISGVVVKIDGQNYLCRMPYAGVSDGDPNDWDNLLGKLDERERKIANQQRFFFWGIETAKTRPESNWDNRVVRGGDDIKARGPRPVNFSNHRLGFRPVLHRMSTEPELSSILGHNIIAFGPCGTSLAGQLVSVSDYDVILRPITAVPGIWSGWSRKAGNEIIIEKGKIKYVRKDD